MTTTYREQPSTASDPGRFSSTAYEQQRVAHLVLGSPRPTPDPPKKPKGMSKLEWRATRERLRQEATRLAPGIEERVALREAWRGIAGTPETNEHAVVVASREGALARLVQTGALDAHQLAAAQDIATAYTLITADVAVRTAKLERSTGGGPNAASAERIARVLLERAYTQWRADVAPHADMLLAIIVDDVGLTAAARRWRMSNRRTRSLLTLSLDRWRRH
ncbi:hypothetical protein [Sphingomonas dokdonensis]|uniref:Uncharacterized protein n=1 Tax=Sphingomonas dokdonensis TaxID=344880 RepID=A0A245ZCZ9_9SPHN|nr:hypothetical protein [Sphingomonas dokdonensis]OWK27563.1 hypothetical protein SPDO_32460 [Sphingomonas dokdonensis]